MLKKAIDTDTYKHQLLPIPAEIDCTQVFSHFADQPWSLLLDSANSEHPDGRYDIIYASPTVSMQFDGNCLSLEGNPAAVRLLPQGVEKLSPFSAVQAMLESLTLEPCYLPWQRAYLGLPSGIGIAGYFGYDLGRDLEVLPTLADKLVEAPDMAIGFYSWAIIKDNKHGQWHLVWDSRFDAPTPEHIIKLADSCKANDNFCLSSDWHHRINQHHYNQALAKIHDYLLAGDCYQVNFAQAFTAQYQGDPWAAYLALRKVNKGPFSSFMRLSESSVLSISPERFIQVKGGYVETKPIKGTMPRSASPDEDKDNKQTLATSSKDKAENLMIVDLLRNDISKHAKPHSVEVPKLFDIESFPAVHHLVSTIRAKLNDNSHPLELLAGAFPGGSITGAPKVRAMEIVEELEPVRRHIYCGSIGYSGIGGDMDTNIAIRTLLAENGNIHCWAGGGIVADSTPESEYKESLDKVSRILPVLRTFNGTD